jgi:hypothetical protein
VLARSAGLVALANLDNLAPLDVVGRQGAIYRAGQDTRTDEWPVIVTGLYDVSGDGYLDVFGIGFWLGGAEGPRANTIFALTSQSPGDLSRRPGSRIGRTGVFGRRQAAGRLPGGRTDGTVRQIAHRDRSISGAERPSRWISPRTPIRFGGVRDVRCADAARLRGARWRDPSSLSLGPLTSRGPQAKWGEPRYVQPLRARRTS